MVECEKNFNGKFAMSLTLLTIGIFIYFMVFCFAHRQWMKASFLSQEIVQNPSNQAALKRMQILGIRFDLKMVAEFLAIPYLITSFLQFFDFSGNSIAWTYAILTFVLGFIFVGFCIGNYYYYKTYNTYFDTFIFAFFEDDTKAVMQNMWDDYPIARSTLATFILALIPAWLSYGILTDANMANSWESITAFIVMVVLFVLSIRGTLKSKPLNKLHAQVSSLKTINYLVPNGVMALMWAIKDHRKASHFAAVSAEEGEQLREELFHQKEMTCRTPTNSFLADNMPHVVFSLMESFGGNILALDKEGENDVLGSLRSHTQQDYFFRRFLSYNNGTASSLLGQCFYSINENLSQSTEQKTHLTHTAFKPYLDKGYKVIFVTSGNAMWRSLSTYFMEQGFHEVYDQNTLMDTFPEAKDTLSYWGVADEFAFKFAEKCLKEAKQPLFIYILTVTNHPPYKAPESYKPYPVNPEALAGRLGENTKERQNILTAYQYATSCLGNFVTQIKHSDLKDRVIIGASGDHHLRGMTYRMPEELFLSYSVPFYLYVPALISEKTGVVFDPKRLGSHKDIFPTLYAMSLSDAEYWNLGGRNILAQTQPAWSKFAYNVCIYADQENVVDLQQIPYVAYQWENDLLVKNPHTLPEAKAKWISEYNDYWIWQMNYLLKGTK